jgi:ABC-type glycerol-3-phosphate transport system substrate-binding protein
MQNFRKPSSFICAALSIAALSACSDDGAGTDESNTADDMEEGDDMEATGPQELRFATWWGGSGEQEAVAALTDGFVSERDRTSVEVVALTNDWGQQIKFYTGRLVEGCEDDCEEGCNASCIDGDPNGDWDIGQENLHLLDTSFSATEEGTDYVSLDLSRVSSLKAGLAAVRPEIRRDLVHDGETLALPIGVHRANTLHYNPELVDEPPNNLRELQAMCDDYVENGGVPPLALAWANWIHSIMFQTLLPVEVLTVEASRADARAAMVDALATLKDFHQRGCIVTPPANVGEHDWAEAARMIIGDENTAKAKMFIHGDWAKGLLVAEGQTPGTDFAVTSFTGGDRDAFRYSGDALAVNENSENLELAIEFAEYALSPEGQAAFNEQKGSTPAIEFDDPSEIRDVQLRKTYEEMQAAIDDGTFLPNGGWLAEVSSVVAKLRPKFVNADGDLVENPDFEGTDIEALADEMMEFYK